LHAEVDDLERGVALAGLDDLREAFLPTGRRRPTLEPRALLAPTQARHGHRVGRIVSIGRP
jgi:hypothetical protein